MIGETLHALATLVPHLSGGENLERIIGMLTPILAAAVDRECRVALIGVLGALRMRLTEYPHAATVGLDDVLDLIVNVSY